MLRPHTIEALKTFTPGKTVTGTITAITHYGVFLDLGEGVAGLVHCTKFGRSKLEWTLAYPQLKINDPLEAQVVEVFDAKRAQVSLNRKATLPKPNDLPYALGDLVTGEIVEIHPAHGIFVTVGPDKALGLIPNVELPWADRLRGAPEGAKAGDALHMMVVEVDNHHHRLNLSLKQVPPTVDPWDTLIEKYTVGSRVDGVIRRAQDYGLFIQFPDVDVCGLLHRSRLGLSEEAQLSKLYKARQPISAIITKIDRELRRVDLTPIEEPKGA